MKTLTVNKFRDWFDSLDGEYKFNKDKLIVEPFFLSHLEDKTKSYIFRETGVLDAGSNKLVMGFVFESINQMMDFIELEDEFNQTYLINCAYDCLSKDQLLGRKEFIRVYEKM